MGASTDAHTVLVVEDNDDHLALVQRALARTGPSWKVEVAHNGTEALGRIESGVRPEIMLIDLNLGGEDGLDLIRQVHGDPRLRATRVVVLSGETDQSRRDAALHLGADEVISKPFDPGGYEVITARVVRPRSSGPVAG